MGWLKSKVSKFVEDKDCKGLGKLLAGNPDLANKGITIPYAVHCRIKEHPGPAGAIEQKGTVSGADEKLLSGEPFISCIRS